MKISRTNHSNFHSYPQKIKRCAAEAHAPKNANPICRQTNFKQSQGETLHNYRRNLRFYQIHTDNCAH
jgi:hypothetical protein